MSLFPIHLSNFYTVSRLQLKNWTRLFRHAPKNFSHLILREMLYEYDQGFNFLTLHILIKYMIWSVLGLSYLPILKLKNAPFNSPQALIIGKSPADRIVQKLLRQILCSMADSRIYIYLPIIQYLFSIFVIRFCNKFHTHVESLLISSSGTRSW